MKKAKLLPKIKSPKDLKNLTEAELKQLAGEIRTLIIDVAAKNGGHLASSLGVVELTLGIHRALNCPEDKLVWDVGHQSYAHKIITGRKAKMYTIRQMNGLSGFPKRNESKYDTHDAGHASTSVGIALGYAKARDLKKQNHKVVAVIGDGSLTGGVAFEALNQAGQEKTDLMVIINDNEQSIAGNVGALSTYFNKIRLDPTYNRLRKYADDIIKNIPKFGKKLYEIDKQVRDGLKHMVAPNMIFEELGFKYFGPIDGHDVLAVENSIKLASLHPGPVMVHVSTKKGKGYDLAEQNSEKFHGVSAFNVKNGNATKINKTPSYTEVFGDALIKIAEKNKNIVAITAAMKSGTGLTKFADIYKDRFFDVGIAEQQAVTFATGLALGGSLPVVAIYSTFLQRAYDQLIHDVCMENVPVVFAIDRSGIVGEDGPTHHGVLDLAYLRAIPNIIVASPKDENELRDLLYSATQYKAPVAIRYPRGNGLGVQIRKNFKRIEIGQGEILAEGKDVLIIALGRMVEVARQSARFLKKKGINPSIINARFVKPLSEELLLDQIKKHKAIITVEESTLSGGLGSAILELMEKNNISRKIKRLGIPDNFIEHGKTEEILHKLNLNIEGISKAVESLLSKSHLQKEPDFVSSE